MPTSTLSLVGDGDLMNGATCYKSTKVVNFIIIDIDRFTKKKKKEYMQAGLPNPQQI